MENIKSGFIKPNKEIIFLEYYELEAWCKSEIQKYIMENGKKMQDRLERFERFSEDYSYFKPYLDFVIFEMKYIQLNPFFMKDAFGSSDGEHYFVQTNCGNHYYDVLGKGAFYFNKASDKNYHIQKDSIIENGRIDVKGNTIELFSNGDIDLNAWGHPGLSCMILNQYCSFSKTLCEDLQEYIIENHSNIYTMYLMERLGFTQVTKRRSHNFICLHSHLFTPEQVRVAYLIKEYYGNDIIPFGQKEDSKPKQLIKEIWGDVYENR